MIQFHLLKQLAYGRAATTDPDWTAGIRYILKQVEEDTYTPKNECGLVHLFYLEDRTKITLLTEDERKEASLFVREHGTLEQAKNYAEGIRFAEEQLGLWRK